MSRSPALAWRPLEGALRDFAGGKAMQADLVERVDVKEHGCNMSTLNRG